MNPGPTPKGDHALTGAERQARYRANHPAGGAGAGITKRGPPVDRRSRPQRWKDAVAELVHLQAEYQAWLDALPASLEASSTADALRTICDLELDALDVDPPRGFGRD